MPDCRETIAMGGHEGTVQLPNGILLNGLLPPEEAYVTRVLDPERWSRAEERMAELISCIQPNQPSEEWRNSVACYVQQLIMKCFSCQVFAFGSVPLKTYLPDGDIDLTAFTNNNKLKDTWASEVRDMLESEQEKSEDAEFHVKEVQYIRAEVKIVKCIVENIVVDISFDQLGGLCTLCFLKEVNRLIDQNHLFKRSLILIKAWCYYESRILGAHHGLISTYALETLVMYIFHVFNNSFAGPLERTLLERMVKNYYSAKNLLMLVALYMLFFLEAKRNRSSLSLPNILMLLIPCVQATTSGVVSVKVYQNGLKLNS